MDRSLWLLMRLRVGGGIRRRARSLRTWKGALLVLVGSLCFLPAAISALFAPRVFVEAQVALIEEHGPLLMFLFCVLNVLLSSGERAVLYAPAEVDFLFAGPYRPRQLLLYKIVGGLGGILLTAVLMTLLFAVHARTTLSAFAGLSLAMGMLFLFTMAVSLFASTVGALAFDRRRRLVLAVLAGVVLLGLAHVGEEAFRLPPRELMARLERSAAVRAALVPFVPFVRAFTAARVWPDLVGWSAAGLAIDGLMAGLVLALGGQYYEATAAASARIYERLRQARAGRAWAGREKYRFGLPMPPRCGGVGPIAWRQLTALTRSLERLASLGVFFLSPVLATGFIPEELRGGPYAALWPLGVLAAMSLFAPAVVGFDFRGDLDRMESLKALPLAPSRLVVGQLVAPLVILTAAQWFSLAAIALLTRPEPWLVPSAAVLMLPLDLLLIEVENLFFLWYPAPWAPANSVDFQTMGRQIILMVVKMACVGFVAGVAGGLGGLAYWLSGGLWPPAVAVAWATLSAFAAAAVPLLAQAFTVFDVSNAPRD